MIEHWPRFLIAAGIGLTVAGVAYDIAFVGIPYQDPSPLLQAAYEADAHFAGRLRNVGGFVTFIGLIAAIVRFVIRFVLQNFR